MHGNEHGEREGLHGSEADKRAGEGNVGATHAYICAEKEMRVPSMVIWKSLKHGE